MSNYTILRGAVPYVSDTHYRSTRHDRDGMLTGFGLDFVEDADPDAIIARLKDLVGISTGDTAEDFKDTYKPPATPAVSSPPSASPPAASPPRPPSGTNVVAAPPMPVVPPSSGGGLSTMAIAGIGAGALLLVGGLVWAKKKGKFK